MWVTLFPGSTIGRTQCLRSCYICSCQKCVGNSSQSLVKTWKRCALCSTGLTLSSLTPPIFWLQLRQTRTQTSSVAIPVPNLEKFPGYLNVLFSCEASSQERQEAEVVNLEVSSGHPNLKGLKTTCWYFFPFPPSFSFFSSWKLIPRCCVLNGSMRSPPIEHQEAALSELRGCFPLQS